MEGSGRKFALLITMLNPRNELLDGNTLAAHPAPDTDEWYYIEELWIFIDGLSHHRRTVQYRYHRFTARLRTLNLHVRTRSIMPSIAQGKRAIGGRRKRLASSQQIP
jgi:hypothetical protein